MSDDKEFINKILAGQDTSSSDIKVTSTQSSTGTSELKHSDGKMSLNENSNGLSHHTYSKNDTKDNKPNEG